MRTLSQCFATVTDHPRLLGLATLCGRAGGSTAKFMHTAALAGEAVSIALTGIPGIGYGSLIFAMGAHARDDWAGTKVAKTFAAAVLGANLVAYGVEQAQAPAVAHPTAPLSLTVK